MGAVVAQQTPSGFGWDIGVCGAELGQRCAEVQANFTAGKNSTLGPCLTHLKERLEVIDRFFRKLSISGQFTPKNGQQWCVTARRAVETVGIIPADLGSRLTFLKQQWTNIALFRQVEKAT